MTRQAGDTFNRYLVSTICRGSRTGSPSGYLYVVDIVKGLQGACPVPTSPNLVREPNPRGGIRGGRGLAIAGNSLYIANGTEILRFDHAWRHDQLISHPWCGNVHDIAFHDDRLWVCSTASDAIAIFNPAGQLNDLINLRSAASMENDGARFNELIDYRNPIGYEIQKSNRLHANGIGFTNDGTPLVSLGRVETDLNSTALIGGIARADGRGRLNIVSTGTEVPLHNVLTLSDGTILTLNSSAGTLCSLRPDGTLASMLSLAAPAPDGFVRGLCLSSNGRLLVGDRNHLLVFDLSKARISRVFTLSNSLNEAVYAISPLPHSFGPLPPALTRRKSA